MGAQSIFRAPLARVDLRSRLTPDASSPAAAVQAAAPVRRSEPPLCESGLLALILEPLQPGETALLGHERKERDLRAAFGALSVLAARSLHLRLSACKADDALALAFGRLAYERRLRLLTFLADARRREALAASKR